MKRDLYATISDSPGVYLMRGVHGKILYIGKAANLRRRVSSYFTRPHDARIEQMVRQIHNIETRETSSALEALILESDLIKQHEPPYNIREKDDKSFLYVEVTRDAFPQVLLVRGTSRRTGKRYGPFTSASSIREALRIIRRIFPYSTHPSGTQLSKPCFEYQVGLCPGTCVGAISKTEYRKHIRNLQLFFEGKKERIIASLERDMQRASRAREYEKAQSIKKKLFSLQHIQDVALIRDDRADESIPGIRIEGYDISNISGTSAVGSMVVFVDGRPARDQYRKFKIRTIHQSNDTGMLQEVVERRLRNAWTLPDLMLIDGGVGQVNAVRGVLKNAGLSIPVIGLAKGPERKRNDIVGVPPKHIPLSTLVKVRDEAHRFARAYHIALRSTRSLFGSQ